MQSALVSLAVVGTMLAASTAASAMGYGDLRSATVLGHPLSVAVPVRLDAGEDLSADCVRAEVYAGDARVDPASVRVRVTYGGERVRQVRVTTTVPIAEPVADVHVSIGCPPRLSRKFVVFADPPEFNLAQQARQVQQAPAVAPAAAEAQPAAVAEAQPAPAAVAEAPSAAVAALTQAVPAAVGSQASSPSAAPAPTASEPAPARARPAAPARAAPQRARPPQLATGATRGASTGSGAAASRARPAAPAPESPRPRLRLDMVEPRPARTPPAPTQAGAARLAQADGTGGSRATLDARAQAGSDSRTQRVADARTRERNGASTAEAGPSQAEAGPSPAASAAEAAARSAEAAQSAASAAEQRVRLLEVELARLRAESLATREQLAQLRAGAPAPADRYLPWLIGLAALLLAVAGWLAWRLAVLAKAQQRREAWYGASELTSESARLEAHEAEEGALAPAASASDETAGPRSTGSGAGAEAARAAAGARAPADEWAAPGPDTVPAPPAQPKPAPVPSGGTRLSAIAPAGRPREVTVEEQIDLEQQADFFMVLGQDEAAIDLLLTHLRGTGGASPMPYLKLLEIYRRRGDEEAYERIRDRFNQRFNGIVPPWTSDPNEGRSLEGYPQVLARVQAAWWSPLDAMAELEAMLYRKGERAERFDLPAYLDVLFLYQAARDLHQHERDAQPAPSLVDVLLPLGDAATERPSTRSAPERPAARRRAPAAMEDVPDLPRIDLDLSNDAAVPKG